MPRSNKPHVPQQPKTGNDYIDLAKSRGASVKPGRRGFTKIETPRGSTYVTPGNRPLDQRTRKNLNHWYKLLGLMLLIAGLVICLFPRLLLFL